VTTPQIPPADPGNQLLCEQPAQLTTSLVLTPVGQRLAVTIRTTSATITVFLRGKDAKAWAAQLTRDAAGMSDAGLITGNGRIDPGKVNLCPR
jgi:hypothetical protein